MCVPFYISQHQRQPPTKITKQVWSEEAVDKLKYCFETTNWDVMIDDTDISSSVETITDYIKYCEETNIPTIRKMLYANNRPWLNKDLKELIRKKHEARKDNNRMLQRQLQISINKNIKTAKKEYHHNMLSRMGTNAQQAWQGIKSMIGNNKRKEAISQPSQQLADDLNSFYCRFEEITSPERSASATLTDNLSQPLFTKEDTKRVLRSVKPKKSTGPDGVKAILLRLCYDQLSPVFHKLFTLVVQNGTIPTLWKTSWIKPLPKKQPANQLNDYRPIALTSIPMKCLETIIKQCLNNSLSMNDIHQYAYKKGRSVRDACAVLDYTVREHLDRSTAHYARILFIDYSSAFNTIRPDILLNKMADFGVDSRIIATVRSFLSNRTQITIVGNARSASRTTSIGAPQGCVLSPLLFSIYTSVLTSSSPSVRILKYADDTAVVGLLSHKDNCHKLDYQTEIAKLADDCDKLSLSLNTTKTKEMVINFSKTFSISDQITIHDSCIDVVDSFKYLGTVFSSDLKWLENTKQVLSKARSRNYLFYKYCEFSPTLAQKQSFYNTFVLSAALFNSEIFYHGMSQNEKASLSRTFKRAGLGVDFRQLVEKRILNYAKSLIADHSHPLNEAFIKSSRSQRFLAPRQRTSRFSTSFVPCAVRQLNA
jgi:hypothetical protein